MIKLETLTGDKPTRVYISLGNGKILGGVADEKLVLRCFCRKGWAIKNEGGEWHELPTVGVAKAEDGAVQRAEPSP